MKPGLSVIIPSRNSANLLNSLAAVKGWDSANVIVVDDGLEWHDRESKQFVVAGSTVIAGEKPFIYARNVNLGIRAAGSDDVILLNDDALLETPGGFTAMHRFALDHPEYGVVSAKTNVCNHLLPLSLSFVCVLIRRPVIDVIGLLDERFTGSIAGEMVYGGEDDDYCYRVRRHGMKIGVFRDCFVDHSKLTSTFRPDGRGLPITATRKRFREIHGFEMRSQ